MAVEATIVLILAGSMSSARIQHYITTNAMILLVCISSVSSSFCRSDDIATDDNFTV